MGSKSKSKKSRSLTIGIDYREKDSQFCHRKKKLKELVSLESMNRSRSNGLIKTLYYLSNQVVLSPLGL